MNSSSPKTLILEGNIGAGKSTFLNIINKFLDSEVVYEPHEKWQNVEGENLLDKFYKDTPRWAYTFQTYAFVTRVLEHEKFSRKTEKEFMVLERSVYSDRYCFAKNCFEMGTMSALEWHLYKDWFAWLVEQYTPKPHGFIYLKTDAEVCFNRLVKRNRLEESEIPLEYLKMLNNKHNDWLIEKRDVSDYLKDVPVLTLECNKDFEFDTNEQYNHLNAIKEFFGVNFKVPKNKKIKTDALFL